MNEWVSELVTLSSYVSMLTHLQHYILQVIHINRFSPRSSAQLSDFLDDVIILDLRVRELQVFIREAALQLLEHDLAHVTELQRVAS